jgi:hypothetical protein
VDRHQAIHRLERTRDSRTRLPDEQAEPNDACDERRHGSRNRLPSPCHALAPLRAHNDTTPYRRGQDVVQPARRIARYKSMTVYLVLLAAIVVLAVLCVATNGVVTRTWQRRIEAWAAKEHLQLASVAPRTLGGRNPWGLWRAKYARFYQVMVIDSAGARRVASVRCHSLSGRIEVRWE